MVFPFLSVRLEFFFAGVSPLKIKKYFRFMFIKIQSEHKKAPKLRGKKNYLFFNKSTRLRIEVKHIQNKVIDLKIIIFLLLDFIPSMNCGINALNIPKLAIKIVILILTTSTKCFILKQGTLSESLAELAYLRTKFKMVAIV